MNKVRAVAAVLLLSLVLTLTACDGGDKKLILGTWNPSPGSGTEFLGTVSKSTWTFNSDGTYKEVEDTVFNGSLYKDVHTGKYELDTKEHYLILKPDDGWHDDTFGDETHQYSYTLSSQYLTITTGLGTERYQKAS